MRTIPEPLTVVDLFAGAGGIAEGFRQAGFRVIAGNDSDPDACATFALNFPDAAVVHGDIRDTAVRKAVLEISIGVDVVVGGPPCQAFSQVRNHVRAIDDPRNSLYREFVNIVGALQPNAFLMENVTGIDQMGLREQMENDLSLGGEYSVSPQVIDAADVGVPQTRKRLLFVGVRKSRCTMVPKIDKSSATRIFGLTRAESRGHPFYAVRSSNDLFSGAAMSALSDTEDLSIVTAAQALSDLVSLPAGGRDDIIPYSELPGPQSAYQRYAREGANEASHNVQVPRIRNDTQARLRAIPPGGNHRDLPEELLARNLGDDRWGPENGSGLLSRNSATTPTDGRIRTFGHGRSTRRVIAFFTTMARARCRCASSPDCIPFRTVSSSPRIHGKGACRDGTKGVLPIRAIDRSAMPFHRCSPGPAPRRSVRRWNR